MITELNKETLLKEYKEYEGIMYEINNKEERDKLIEGLKNIKELNKAEREIIRELYFSELERNTFKVNKNRSRLNEELPEDAIWLEHTTWKEEDFINQTYLLKNLKINKVYYTDKSTAALNGIVWFTKMGAKIIGTTKITDSTEGLIIEL